jgi:hypothetical protein
MAKAREPDVVLRLRSLPSSVPVGVRLRRLLKCCRRSFQFQATAIEELPADAEPAVPVAPPAARDGNGRENDQPPGKDAPAGH